MKDKDYIFILRLFVGFIFLILLVNGLIYYVFNYDISSLLQGKSFCLFYNVTGLKCPGCGMTGAFLAIGRGHFRLALQYNPFSGLLLIMMGTVFLPKRIRSSLLEAVRCSRILWALIVMALVLAVYRNIV